MADERRASPWGRQAPTGEVMLSLSWEMFVLVLAIVSIVNLGLVLVAWDPDVQEVLVVMDAVLMVVFAIDFLRRLAVATDNRAYFVHGRGWLDFVSIFPALRIARVLRILRVFKLMQHLGGPKAAFRAFFRNRAAGGLLLVLAIAFMVMEFGSILILWAERDDPGANITTASDALWYTIVTMSTVGYGDQFPVTNIGRLFGTVIIVVGVGVFGTLTGFLANAFITPRTENAPPGDQPAEGAPADAKADATGDGTERAEAAA